MTAQTLPHDVKAQRSKRFKSRCVTSVIRVNFTCLWNAFNVNVLPSCLFCFFPLQNFTDIPDITIAPTALISSSLVKILRQISYFLCYPVFASLYPSFSILSLIFCLIFFFCCPEVGIFFHTSRIFNPIEVFFLPKSYVTATANDRFRQTWDKRNIETVVPVEQEKEETGGARLRLTQNSGLGD